MKKSTFLIILPLIFAAEIAALFVFATQNTGDLQDAVAVNEIVQQVQADWNAMANHENRTNLDYVVLDENGTVIFKTKEGLSESLNAAVMHRDTILDIEAGFAAGAYDIETEVASGIQDIETEVVSGIHDIDTKLETAIPNIKANRMAVGKVIIYNNSVLTLQRQRQTTIFVLTALLFVQCCVCIGYNVYLNHAIIRPFGRLKGFAERVAGGNLDIPLEMDRQNIFGAFTESFDIMRSELKSARIAEAQANASKKELVAKLSHDIKTPVASIKAASEVGIALADSDKIRDNYTQIIRKADQINTLINNLFTATLEELRQLSVSPQDMESTDLKALLEDSDYLHRALIPDIPECLLYADRLRLQQVFDNIFANSYKYANTKIEVTVYRDDNYFAACIEDDGGGVSMDEAPLLKEKFKRGSNTKDIEGAGLGLYISDYFMREMHGELVVENGKNGLKATVMIPLSGII